MPVLNAKIRAFDSYVESLNLYNLYFVACPPECLKLAK